MKNILFTLALLISFSSFGQTAEEYFNSGRQKYEAKDYGGAIRDFNKSIELEPGSVVAYFQRAKAKKMIVDYEGAKEDFDTALLNITYTDTYFQGDLDLTANIYYHLAITEMLLEEYDQAIRSFSAAIELDPNPEVDYYIKRGNSKDKLKDYNGAINDYNKVLELEPNNAGAYYNIGNMKRNLKDYYGAISDYTKAIELAPNYIAAYYNRGNSKDKLKDYNGAISDYSKVIELNPNLANAYYNRAIAKSFLGYDPCADIKKGKELSPLLGKDIDERLKGSQCHESEGYSNSDLLIVGIFSFFGICGFIFCLNLFKKIN